MSKNFYFENSFTKNFAIIAETEKFMNLPVYQLQTGGFLVVKFL